ncbi:MAG: cytochrome c [Pseudomonadota bacterium]
MLPNKCRKRRLKATRLCLLAAFAFHRMTGAAWAENLTPGQAPYAEHCLSCHQADGGGVPFVNPALAGGVITTGPSDLLIGFVLAGSGDSTDGEWENPMPGFAHLDDKALAAILTYVRTSFGNKAAPIDASEVAAARAQK